MATKEPSPIIRLLPGTREKLDRIAAETRWKLNVIVDEAVNHYSQTVDLVKPAEVRKPRRKASA